MEQSKILELISGGRTDFMVELMKKPGWQELLKEGQIKPLQWLVYYNDVTGLRLVTENGGTLESINIHEELPLAQVSPLDWRGMRHWGTSPRKRKVSGKKLHLADSYHFF